ncbi:hypothetical protein QC761_0108200 [Podospora bellae-mahoneyi]|uniref:Uncharacterized protein n=1 Tax=Podospora bellae-mahoneyi TaxID=2093777 RepID=A0ABR0F619_9PEZI|nr:hypothetical protein QC761_0108200 [Podospora bellae-mahoneyi]
MCAICDASKQASASTHLVTHSNLSLFAPGVLLLGSFPGEACDPLPFGVYAERQDVAVKPQGPPALAMCGRTAVQLFFSTLEKRPMSGTEPVSSPASCPVPVLAIISKPTSASMRSLLASPNRTTPLPS